MQLTEKIITPRCKIQDGSQARPKHTLKLNGNYKANIIFKKKNKYRTNIN